MVAYSFLKTSAYINTVSQKQKQGCKQVQKTKDMTAYSFTKTKTQQRTVSQKQLHTV